MGPAKIILDVVDPEALERFWAEALGYRRRGAAGAYVALAPPEGQPGVALVLQRVPEPKVGKNRMHFDFDVDDAAAEIERLTALGATVLDDRWIEEHGMRWKRLADPEGNEFCVCEC